MHAKGVCRTNSGDISTWHGVQILPPTQQKRFGCNFGYSFPLSARAGRWEQEATHLEVPFCACMHACMHACNTYSAETMCLVFSHIRDNNPNCAVITEICKVINSGVRDNGHVLSYRRTSSDEHTTRKKATSIFLNRTRTLKFVDVCG